jgi:hypothetical protein
MSSTAIRNGSGRSTSECLRIVFVNSDVQLYRFCPLHPTLPTWKQKSKVRTDHADPRKMALKIGHIYLPFEHFGYSALVNLQLSRGVNRSRGGFSIDQWLRCATFAPKSHISRRKLRNIRAIVGNTNYSPLLTHNLASTLSLNR